MPSWTISGINHIPPVPALPPPGLICPTAKHSGPNPHLNARGVARTVANLTAALCSTVSLSTSTGEKTETWGGQ